MIRKNGKKQKKVGELSWWLRLHREEHSISQLIGQDSWDGQSVSLRIWAMMPLSCRSSICQRMKEARDKGGTGHMKERQQSHDYRNCIGKSNTIRKVELRRKYLHSRYPRTIKPS